MTVIRAPSSSVRMPTLNRHAAESAGVISVPVVPAVSVADGSSAGICTDGLFAEAVSTMCMTLTGAPPTVAMMSALPAPVPPAATTRSAYDFVSNGARVYERRGSLALAVVPCGRNTIVPEIGNGFGLLIWADVTHREPNAPAVDATPATTADGEVLMTFEPSIRLMVPGPRCVTKTSPVFLSAMTLVGVMRPVATATGASPGRTVTSLPGAPVVMLV